MGTPGNLKRVVVVLGMGRSGTSTIARSLAAIGVDLGQDLLAASFDNPKGFWEDNQSREINDALLAAMGQAWHTLFFSPDMELTHPSTVALHHRAVDHITQTFGSSRVWGFKDPRTVRVLPFWLNVFQSLDLTPSFVIAVRNPLSVADSLASRDGFAKEKSLLLWLCHTLAALVVPHTYDRVVVDYDGFLEKPYASLMRVASQLNLPPPVPDDEFFTAFVDQRLRHTRYHIADLLGHPLVMPLIRQAYTLAIDLAYDRMSVEAEEVRHQVDKLCRELLALKPVLDYINELETRCDTLQGRLRDGEHAWAMLREALAKSEAEREVGTEINNRLQVELKQREEDNDAVNHRLRMAESEVEAERRLASGLRDQILAYERSTSWRLTAPVRSVVDKVVKPRRKP